MINQDLEEKIAEWTEQHERMLSEMLAVQCSMGFNVLDPRYAKELRKDLKLVLDRLSYGHEHNKHMVVIPGEWG